MGRERLAEQAVGGPGTVRERLAQLLADTGVDELMVTTSTHDPADRLRSMELVRGLFGPDDLPRGWQGALTALAS
jgi:alkanesulfonate monooxygenase SsuD/methylene tetrahydromethanopterin reductase-like flavin-dependent oxidoreductase (luciferase family)